MNKFFKLLFLTLFALILFPAAAMADQDGNAIWCNMDAYGCWVYNEDGGQDYLMFWSEDARQYFMGDSTPPYTNVVDFCYDCSGDTMGMGESDGEDVEGTWRNALIDVYRKYQGTFYTGKWADSQISAMTEEMQRNLDNGKWKEKDLWGKIKLIEESYEIMAEKAGIEVE